MVELQVRGQVTTGQITLDTGISDLEFVDGANGPMLVSVSGPEGGLASFALSSGGLPQARDQTFFVADQVSGAGFDLIVTEIGGQTELMVTGVQTNGLASHMLGSSGQFGAASDLDGATFGTAPAVAAQTPDGRIVLADPGQPGFSIYGSDGSGGLVNGTHVADTASTHADMVGSVAALSVAGSNIIVVASQTEYGVTAYTLDSGAPVAADSIGPAQGLGIMVPTDMAVAETSQGSFVIVASEPANGQSGALSVMRVDPSGGLVPVDHVLDTRDSRFGDVQKVETVSHQGHVYVVAAGGDAGLTLMELMPNGQLVHLDSIAGTPAAGLDDVTALEIAVVGDVLQIFAATDDEAGFTMLSVDISDRGVALVAGDGGTTLTGTVRDDILLDGKGADTLQGGDGADRYVLIGDGQTDTILGFDPAKDILDLSGLPFLYDPAALEITSTPDGATITHRGETIVLRSQTGAPLDVEAVRAAVEIAINRSLPSVSLDLEGSDAADMLVADWGADTLKGLNGDDTLDGGDGDDVLEGGWDNDLLFGGGGADDLNAGRGNDTVYGGTGNDSIYGAGGDDSLFGEDGDDLIFGQGENDTIDGGSGNDTLNGDLGDDLIFGGAGDDVLNGNDGNDTLHGGDGADVIEGEWGNDLIYGGEGSDTLSGGAGNDGLDGGDGADWLNGGDGADTATAGAGDDLLEGGAGNDWLNGGPGDDTLTGGDGADTFWFLAGDGTDRYTEFDASTDKLLIDSQWMLPRAGFKKYVKTYIHVTEEGIVLDFGDGDMIVIENYIPGHPADAIGFY